MGGGITQQQGFAAFSISAKQMRELLTDTADSAILTSASSAFN
jgi:hypothetical protein